MGSEGGLSEFIDGLGPGQLVGRQVLASPALGEIQLSLCDRRGNLEVEVIRARGLQCKPGSKVLPGNCLLILSKKNSKLNLDQRKLLFNMQVVFFQYMNVYFKKKPGQTTVVRQYDSFSRFF
jgi:hypothetical protein